MLPKPSRPTGERDLSRGVRVPRAGPVTWLRSRAAAVEARASLLLARREVSGEGRSDAARGLEAWTCSWTAEAVIWAASVAGEDGIEGSARGAGAV